MPLDGNPRDYQTEQDEAVKPDGGDGRGPRRARSLAEKG